VTRFVVEQYKSFLPTVRQRLANSLSKIRISFDNWTTRGGKKALTGIFVHHLNQNYSVDDYPIGLPLLSSVHTGERIGEVV